VAWFSARFEPSVTAQAPLVEKCLDEVSVRGQRGGRALPPQAFLPRGIREAAALAPYLGRWRAGDLSSC
jgi:hypothetical protein